MSSKKMTAHLTKLSNLLNRSGAFTKVTNNSDIRCQGSMCLYVESKTFSLRGDNNLKIYLHGTLTYDNNTLEKYGTKFVLSQKDMDTGKEKIVFSVHFDGDINETKIDHPIYHMQFDNSIIDELKPKSAQEDHFKKPNGENKQIRIPTPQMDIFSVIFFYLKAMDTNNFSKLRSKYLDEIKTMFFIDTIEIGHQNNIAKIIFP